MSEIDKIKVTTGVYWVSIPEAELNILCGCPADVIKHLKRKGLIVNRKKNGVVFETGPNAILLSDVAVQNGQFCNLAEFPVLQMMYRQGMLIPGHVNNTKVRPLLIGVSEQISAQMQYIYRGNYGLTTKEEIMEAGIEEEEAERMMQLKLKFAFGKIYNTDELIETKPIGQGHKQIRNGVSIRRLGVNIYEISYKGNAVTVDLNLKAHEGYVPAYYLGVHPIEREYFAVIHSGSGDGWDYNRPCMSSILMFQGKVYLIDAGPNISDSLTALGIGVNEIEGVFHTHAHDDHFAGLTTLIRADHRIKYFATPLIRASAAKKLSALMSIDEQKFAEYFDIHDLDFDTWNNIQGLEVKPVFSPHPVETNIFMFRALWGKAYKTYAHFADIVSLNVLKGMIKKNPQDIGITEEYYEQVKASYLEPANLKKLDIGGGLIHGMASDFAEDQSDKIILSHIDRELTDPEKQTGSDAPFGTVDVLIPTQQNYNKRYAYEFINAYFPDIPIHEIRILLNYPIVSFNAGSIIFKKGVVNEYIYLVLTGLVQFLGDDLEYKNTLTAGSLIGEFSGVLQTPTMGTFRSLSTVQVLEIPSVLYRNFIRRNDKFREIEQVHIHRLVIQNTWLFGEMISTFIQSQIAKSMVPLDFKKGEELIFQEKPSIYLLQDGIVDLISDGVVIQTLKPGEFFGEETVLFGTLEFFSLEITQHTQLFAIPSEILMDIPIVHWKLLQVFEQRMQMVIAKSTIYS